MEPRFSALAVVSYRFTAAKREARPTTPPPKPAPKPVAPPPVEKPTAAPVDITLTDDLGNTVPDAKVTLKTNAGPKELPGDGQGHYRLDEVPAGKAEITIEAPGFEPVTQPLEVNAGVPLNLPMKLKALPPPSQVRGVVRSYGGRPVSAHIHVDPLGMDAQTDADGSFQLDVPPGSYEITIDAPGYESQHRKVQVEAQGVVILNADLTKRKR